MTRPMDIDTTLLSPEAQTALLEAITRSHHHRSRSGERPGSDLGVRLPLPPPSAIAAAESSLPSPSSPDYLAGRPAADVVSHITRDILPAMTGQAQSGRYYGFVTGGALPVGQWADGLVGRIDQNVQVHLPSQTAATAVEDSALEMAARLVGLDAAAFPGRTITTGATACNMLGLACGREAVVADGSGSGSGSGNGSTAGGDGGGIGELGILEACSRKGIREFQVLTSGGHSSLSKAASIVGLGRRSVKELGISRDEPWILDLDAVEDHLARPAVASIISVSAGEVNTGRYAVRDMPRLRALADKYGAWIHVDAAFGIFARLLPDSHEFATLKKQVEGLELADSITIDAHKVLNVPYDCGIFFTRSLSTLQAVCTNGNAAYLLSASADAPSSIPSPLNVGLENSRRFRALPLYAVLLSEGRAGLSGYVTSMVRLSRRLASYIQVSEHYDLLPDAPDGAETQGDGDGDGDAIDQIFIIVLFRARDARVNDVLVERINATRSMYVSGTSWRGEKAARIAVSSWKVDADADFDVVTSILEDVALEGRGDRSRGVTSHE
ncbi:Glutamate or tyrosine decarboxylase or a related PLP-dependent protein [Geosmithia morbida]|uniref:Glutamate or tyrosine decarboxylase or a related PLP-dependent protein n=1 Tax=Geosmithia morbida TaxID=1094350 RepID=A0A9P5D8Q6_9HYPO|nr:Glutamate or tyrosine decarboxylase or a related PLP-dependent protein [Geosmithia morbida]KAF4125764.1 Glutamate or tyrosine decarboxylase or a related PLP-dependent protein [Geosmithia morbida]